MRTQPAAITMSQWMYNERYHEGFDDFGCVLTIPKALVPVGTGFGVVENSIINTAKDLYRLAGVPESRIRNPHSEFLLTPIENFAAMRLGFTDRIAPGISVHLAGLMYEGNPARHQPVNFPQRPEDALDFSKLPQTAKALIELFQTNLACDIAAGPRIQLPSPFQR